MGRYEPAIDLSMVALDPVRVSHAGGSVSSFFCHIKEQVLHDISPNLIFMICIFIIPSPTRARKRKKPLTDGSFRSW